MKYILLLFCSSFYGQYLHHQTLSSQGNSTTLSNGITVKQSIGQQSVIGNSKNEFIIQQGYQQNYWAKIISSSTITNNLTILTYPNPFISNVNFQFSKPMEEDITITVFDVAGRLISQQKKKATDMLLTINLVSLPNSAYLVRLSNSQLNHYTKILKSI
jgi:hypothetical protein